jgi:hypothetical protein
VIKRVLNYKLACLMVLAIFLAMVAAVPFSPDAHAEELFINRSLSFIDVNASAIATHTVSFTFPTINTVGSVELDYCTSPVEAVPCTPPPGLDASGAVLSAQTGASFSVLSTTVNKIILTRAPAVTDIVTPNSYVFDNVKNPSSLGPFYLRITSRASTDASGATIDYGGTVGSINRVININAEVPPVLIFCTGVIIPGDCSTAEGSFLDLGTFSSSFASVGTTQMAAYTNANFGYVIQVSGSTMASGNHALTPLAAPSPSAPGTRQFGMNLRANLAPLVGADPIGGGPGGTPVGNYNIPNRFSFNDGDVIATSPSLALFETYTITYLVNVPDNQAPGIYNTTLMYTATSTF